ncbi:hypothetical protein BJ944DRAFT_262154 [Cunninghamella echinulata]|nr:hypothetical protein BJ944DRAFT_262154 [Cunninghamella echinulata]
MPSKSLNIDELADIIQNLDQCTDFHKQIIQNLGNKKNSMSSHKKRWLYEEELVLEMLVEKNVPWPVISQMHGRTESAIKTRWSHIRNRLPPIFMEPEKNHLIYDTPKDDTPKDDTPKYDTHIPLIQKVKNEKTSKGQCEQKLTNKHRYQKINEKGGAEKEKLNDMIDDDEENIQQIANSLELLQISSKKKPKHQQAQQHIQHQKQQPVNKNTNLTFRKIHSTWSDEDDLLLVQLCAIKLPYKYISSRLSVKRTPATISNHISFLKSQGVGNLYDYYAYHGKPLDSSGIPDLKSLTHD